MLKTSGDSDGLFIIVLWNLDDLLLCLSCLLRLGILKVFDVIVSGGLGLSSSVVLISLISTQRGERGLEFSVSQSYSYISPMAGFCI